MYAFCSIHIEIEVDYAIFFSGLFPAFSMELMLYNGDQKTGLSRVEIWVGYVLLTFQTNLNLDCISTF